MPPTRSVVIAAAVIKKNDSEVKNEVKNTEDESNLTDSELVGFDSDENAKESSIQNNREDSMAADTNKNDLDDDFGGFDEPDVMDFDEEVQDKPKKSAKQQPKESGEGLLAKIMGTPWYIKAGAILIIVFLVMLKDEMSNSKTAENTVLEENATKAPEVKPEEAALEKPIEEQKLEKLNACVLAQAISFKFEGGGLIPMFGEKDISNGAVFCDEFTLSNYKLDGSNNNLSVTGEIYSNGAKVKSISVDPLAYFKPNYYYEGIGMRHPKTGAEAVYMAGDVLLGSQGMSLKLASIKDVGDSVVYNFDYNGQPTSITISKKYVQ